MLACGYDTIVLAIDVIWNDQSFFDRLDDLKERAKGTGQPMPGVIRVEQSGCQWVYNVQPNGSKGYEWLLAGREYTMKIGRWLTPKDRPSVMVEVRSETLWHLAPQPAVDRACQLISASGGKVVKVKASRADPCVDLVIRSRRWSLDLLDHIVTRAASVDPHLHRGKFTGVSIGRGEVLARLYDKPLEIAMRSQKTWMYDIWNIAQVPDAHTIVRIEFQFRREALKELKIDTVDDLFTKDAALWAYATRKWLKVQDDPSAHHTQQRTLPWWKVVQAGWAGAQSAAPLVREKAIEGDRRQLARQVFGSITSLIALNSHDEELADGATVDLAAHIDQLHDLRTTIGMDDGEATTRARKKLAKFKRAKTKAAENNRAPTGHSIDCPATGAMP